MTGPHAPADLRAAVRGAAARLAEAGVPSPDVDAVALAAHVLRTTASQVRTAMVVGAPAPDPAAYGALVEQRVSRVPLQHLTGRAAFRRLELAVGPGVFTPRPETEVVAGLAIDAARAVVAAPVVVDLCTGSGAIALAVADELPSATVYAVELGEDAHAWAARNVADTGLPVTLVHGDATTAFPELDGTVDVVVSNPPYIPVGMVPVDPEVRDHDPELALYGGSEDGLAIPLAVGARAAALLRPGGVLVMEHADSQGESLPRALERTGCWRDVHDERDLTGRPRATVATRA
ncbi:peptide chain release factor N(5)-glutamine methyltransferase [Phycicoccus sp. Soil748]|uniref:peptide chain release factor N(5)-glutamine methyltransferase n=1 Tax=Phycicoccus sp. Soil748 TaxID=1736397 RepID=UPI000702D382|nr:peptide chain release factor N(5)-glutamine methyltransferase [Phycicoccus sp. Soil748]KRE55095.1 protein-(glutamine-N5) methyltransferase, release factor-specific [Phycicoccus sp. Soil748]